MTEQETAFLGKITAGMTHEIRNVLAIIKESAGFMGDLLDRCPDGSFPHQDRFPRILSKIQDQVGRGVEISTHLNRLAHSMDEPEALVKLNDLLDDIVFLMQRFARLKKVQLEAAPAVETVEIRVDPLRLQVVLAAGIEYLLNRARPEGVITLRPEKTDQGVTIQISTELDEEPGPVESAPSDVPPGEFAGLQGILNGLGAQLTPFETSGQTGLTINMQTRSIEK